MPSLVGSEMCIRDRDTLEAVRYLGRHRPAVKPSGLLEIGELRYLHAVEPDFPPEAPGPEGGRFPVVLHEPYVVFARVYPEPVKTVKVEADDIGRRGLRYHLELEVAPDPVGVLPCL